MKDYFFRKPIKKDLDYYLRLKYKFNVVESTDSTGFIFAIPELNGCKIESKSWSAGYDALNTAKDEWIREAWIGNELIPEPGCCDYFSGQFKLRIPRHLHKSLTERARDEGVSLNYFCVYLLTRNLNYNARRDKMRNDIWKP